jgi:hypothetical protein
MRLKDVSSDRHGRWSFFGFACKVEESEVAKILCISSNDGLKVTSYRPEVDGISVEQHMFVRMKDNDHVDAFCQYL